MRYTGYIFRLFCEGYTIEEIAKKLNLTESYIEKAIDEHMPK